jgi:hypothetical protein
MQLLEGDRAGDESAAASAPPLSHSLCASNQLQLREPLPPGWELLFDASGRPYYGNPSLLVTQYQHPGSLSPPSHGAFVLHAQRPPVHQPPPTAAGGAGARQSLFEMQELDAAAQMSPRSTWQRCTDAYGRRYVHNTITGETKWEYGS